MKAEEIANGFAKGLVKDIADTAKENTTYEDALDIRLNSNAGASDYIVTNVKGNEFLFTVPDTPNIITIEVVESALTSLFTTSTQLVTSSGIATGSLITGTNTDVDDFVDQIEDSLNNDFPTLNLNVARIGNRLRVWSYTTEIISFSAASSYTEYTLQVAQLDQKIIGWDNADNTIYLLVTNDNTSTGGVGSWYKLEIDDVTLTSTISLLYSDLLNVTQQFPIANPGGIETVHETPSIARSYWTDRLNDLKSINFADENLMAVSPSTIGISLDIQLDKPTLEEVVDGGSLLVGHYQVSYALRTLAGGVTPYAHTSNSIFITDDSINNSYQTYNGAESQTVSNNAFIIKIDNVDTSFEYIDIIILRKEDENGVTFIDKVAEIPASSSTIYYKHTGTEEASTITEVAFTKLSNLFRKCYTIAQKDNILFAANTSGDQFDIDFDARAYRFASRTPQDSYDHSTTPPTLILAPVAQSHGLVLSNNTPDPVSTTTLLLPSFPFEYEEDADAINQDQEIYRYQSDGETLGGEGPNVSYKFVDKPLAADYRETNAYAYPWRWIYHHTPGSVNVGGSNYETGDSWPDFKSPYIDHIYRSHRRGETYRYSLVPVKDGREGYAKWVGDIRMPDIFEDYQEAHPLDAPENEGKIFPLATKTGTKTWHVNALGIEFTVNVPADIREQVDEFRIKRVKIEDKDKSVIAQGMIHYTMLDTRNNSYMLPLGNDHTNGSYYHVNHTLNYAYETSSLGQQLSTYTPWKDYGVGYDQEANEVQVRNGTQRIVTLQSPDFLFGKTYDHRPGDRIKIVQGIIEYDNVKFKSDDQNNKQVQNGAFWKLYQGVPLEVPLFGPYREIRAGQSCGWDDDFTIDGSKFENRSLWIEGTLSHPLKGVNNVEGGRYSRGSDTTVLALDEGFSVKYQPNARGSGLSFDPLGMQVTTGTARPDKYMVNIVRDNDGAYGGQTHAARTTNQYINTGTIIKITDASSYTVDSYGGDTFVNIFDTLKMVKNLVEDDNDDVGSGGPNYTGHRRSMAGVYFPVESSVNTDLREGYHLNGKQNPSGYWWGNDPLPSEPDLFVMEQKGEWFAYNYVYSQMMDTQRSFPIPVNADYENVHPVRIWASATKVYGELTDAWRLFDGETYIDIRGDLGEIRQLINQSDTLIAFQERGIGVASVNDRSVLNDSEGKGIVIGKSGVLPRYDYLSTVMGAWHQFSFAQSAEAFTFFDKKDGGIYMYSQQGIVDLTQDRIKGWLYENTRGQILQHDGILPIGAYRAGITATYDNRNKEFLITFHDANDITDYDVAGEVRPEYEANAFTIAYDDKHQRFTSFRSYKPTMYINNNKHLISPDPDNGEDGYLHDKGDRGVFYGNDPSTSHVTIVVNKHASYPKVFDYMRWLTEVFDANGVELTDETFSKLTVWNPYQTTGERTEFIRRLREWRHNIVYEQGTKNRIRSHYCKQKFEFTNNDDKEFKLHYLINSIRVFLK